MPVIDSQFRSPWWMPGGDLQTQLPLLLRWQFPLGETILIPTRDNDQLSASWYKANSSSSSRLVIMSHGLEGSNRQHYILGYIDYLQKNGLNGQQVDILAWNLRSCGSPENKTHKVYFAGSVNDLDDVIRWAESVGYQEILLVGYSLGGNITLRWLGEQGVNATSRKIKAVCTASSTVDLKSTVDKLDRIRNFFYRLYFVTSMKCRVEKKAKEFPGTIDLSNILKVTSFNTYDEFLSAPMNGFASAVELHAAASSLSLLHNISVPCLMVQAKNDPFLAENSFPYSVANDSQWLTLEVSQTGGHVGFLSNRFQWYLDVRFSAFLSKAL